MIVLHIGDLMQCQAQNALVTANKEQFVLLDAQVHQEYDCVCQAGRFRPYFDNLGLAGQNFEQILVPGSGSQDIDVRQANIFASTRQIAEKEVKDQLNKLPYELIGKNALLQMETSSFDQQIYKRYQTLFDSITKNPTKTIKGKKYVREERIRVQKEISEMTAKRANKESDDYMSRFKKMVKK